MFYAVENAFFFGCICARSSKRANVDCIHRMSNEREGGLLFDCTFSLALKSTQDAHMRQIENYFCTRTRPYAPIRHIRLCSDECFIS